ncbi:hypothetical protein PTSG_09574 [Salpingoeca rosetta]|uniref:BolA family protein n=1 Tax=Salpingoeca rosetta (strain ATCC 50818 / BSB-021) TaxID=946362 RepID=F2ULE0_SALR5|nr:uncharacterized protein PTSG_09574 [Salpingoeca rosetta]EGD77939.1 hypothetical protein PTSG_09574 [Salpingoeca rosetta]|eukprot:XP_004990002.1 hypothetical protein PTSG_09574 [Salpingoeca rosetta]
MRRAAVWTRQLQVGRVLRETQLEATMASKLKKEFNTDHVQVVDQSGGCGSAFRVSVESEAFRGLPTIKQHRLVQSALKEEVAGMHSIQVFTRAPEDKKAA